MLDIGWAEMFVIGVVLLIVVGPKDLPRVLYQAGRYVGRARAMARDAYHGLQEMVEEAQEEAELPDRIEIKSPISPPMDNEAISRPDDKSTTTT